MTNGDYIQWIKAKLINRHHMKSGPLTITKFFIGIKGKEKKISGK